VALAAVAMGVAWGGGPAGEAGASACPSRWTIVPSPNDGESLLFSVKAISSNDVWAVGERHGIGRTLAEHWDGASWTIVPTVNPSDAANVLQAVDGVATDDVWAVGYSRKPSGKDQPLIEHWNGAAWSVVDLPTPGQLDGLVPLLAIASDDVWSAGGFISHFGREALRFVHWDGSSWSVVPGPALPTNESFFVSGFSATGPSDVWAVGFSDKGTFTVHWDGAAWTVVPSPSPDRARSRLQGVVAISPTDAWAVGEDIGGQHDPYLVEHWNGASWSVVPTTHRPGEGFLYNVAAVSSGDLWASGDITSADGKIRTLIMHWDGASWSQVRSPNRTRPVNQLVGIAASTPAGDVWAVGFSEGHAKTLIERACGV
jgi:hypothetical protein